MKRGCESSNAQSSNKFRRSNDYSTPLCKFPRREAVARGMIQAQTTFRNSATRCVDAKPPFTTQCRYCGRAVALRQQRSDHGSPLPLASLVAWPRTPLLRRKTRATRNRVTSRCSPRGMSWSPTLSVVLRVRPSLKTNKCSSLYSFSRTPPPRSAHLPAHAQHDAVGVGQDRALAHRLRRASGRLALGKPPYGICQLVRCMIYVYVFMRGGVLTFSPHAGPTTCKAAASRSGARRMLSTSRRNKVR